MATLANAIEHLKLNDTPIWWLYNGSTKEGQYIASDNLEDSINHLQTTVGLLTDGNYKLKSTDKKENHSGAVFFNFSKSGKNAQVSNMQSTSLSNEYGLPDHVVDKIKREARQELLFQQMSDKFGPLVELVKDLEARVKKIEKYLDEDEDGNGTADFLETGKKLTDVAKGAMEMKQLFDGKSLFS